MNGSAKVAVEKVYAGVFVVPMPRGVRSSPLGLQLGLMNAMRGEGGIECQVTNDCGGRANLWFATHHKKGSLQQH
jgi:hypothetical protein